VKTRIRLWALVAAGVLAGTLLLTPVGAHINDSVSHVWGDHIKPKADQRYVRLAKSPWARVAENGDLIGGEGIAEVTAAPADDGEYTIEFDRKVDECAGTATSWTPDLIASIQQLESDKFIDVELVNTLNNGVDGEFSVMFRC
jgi:hypothetical protein